MSPEPLVPSFSELRRLLFIASASRSLPRSGRDDRILLDSRSISSLLGIASRLALSDNPDERNEAYEIASRILEVVPAGEFAPHAAVDLILTRLGNFPGRDLVHRRFGEQLRGSRLPPRLRLEAIARESENTVELTAEQEVVLTDFQYELLEALGTPANVSVSAPTSAGKSFVLSLDIVRRFGGEGRAVIVYLVPTRALIRQVLYRITSELRKCGRSDIPVRCVPVPPIPGEAPRGIVYVLTQERLLNLLYASGASPGAVSLLIVDEAQGVHDGARGVILQSAIDAVLQLNPSVKLSFVSPLSNNPDYLLRLFDRQDGGRWWIERQSPVSQNLILVRQVPDHPSEAEFELVTDREVHALGRRSLGFPFRGGRTARARFARFITRRKDCTLIYANGGASAEELCEELTRGVDPDREIDSEVADLIQFIREQVHPEYRLAEYLRYSVAFHHGGVPAAVRSRVEELVSAGKLRFVCCTSTLLQGVNLPVRNIVIENPRRGMDKPMNRADFLNLAGRAGRLTQEFHGNVWCLLPNLWAKPSYTGERLQNISAAFEDVLLDGGSLIEKVLDEKPVSHQDKGLGTAALGKLFSEYTLSGRSLLNSKYASPANADALQGLQIRCDSIRVSLPSEVFRKNFTILPHRLEDLFQLFYSEDSLEPYIPLYPSEVGSNVRMKEIFLLVEQRLGKRENNSYKFHAWLAARWIRDVSLRELIELRIQKDKERGFFKGVDKAVSSLMDTIESELRFRYVKHLRAYSDVLTVAIERKNRRDLLPRIAPLHLYLECGASDKVTLQLISLGLSRTTALLLKKATPLPATETTSECFRALQSLDIAELALPALCRVELEGVLGIT